MREEKIKSEENNEKEVILQGRFSKEFLTTEVENQFFDRKSAKKKPEEIVKHLVGFANASGGILVVGVEDNGELTGFQYIGAHSIEEFKTASIKLLRDTPIMFEVIEVPIENCRNQKDTVLVFDIKPSTKQVIICYDREVYLRIKDETHKLSYEQRRLLEYDKGQRFFEDEEVIDSGLEDIDGELLFSYKQKMGAKDSSDEEILIARNLLKNGHLTNAGVLLFAKYPTKYIPNARMKFLRFDGNRFQTGSNFNLIKEITIEGPLPRMIEKAKEVLNSQLRDFQFLSQETGKFEIMPEYPEFAWFEGIVNALVHRDYSVYGDYIRISMYDDRLEIFSPGKLPNIVTLENMKYTRYSRNPRIARILSEFGWVKELNEGVKRIFSEMEKQFLKFPSYSEPNENAVQLNLENNILNRSLRMKENLEQKISQEIFNSLNEDEKLVLYYASMNNHVTVKEMSQYLNRGGTYTRNLLKDLREKNLLKWCGSNAKDPKQYYYLEI